MSTNNTEEWISLKEIGNSHVNEGRFTEAIIVYTKAIQSNPNQPVLYSNRAIVELKLKMFKEARLDAETAIDLYQATAEETTIERTRNLLKYNRLLSEALLEMNLLEEASTVCKRGLELDSRDAVLMIRARNICALRFAKEGAENPREDLKTSIGKLLNDPAQAMEDYLAKLAKLKLTSEDIWKIESENKFSSHAQLISKLRKAHEW